MDATVHPDGRDTPGQGRRTAPPAAPRASAFEYREITLPRGTSRGAAREQLTEEAEYGRWELAGVRLYVGGLRRVVLRRRIIRMQRSA
ncbi:DUF5703 family protein [Pseudokineococcus lusitanus]|jgi:hypothetical protein|uniref:Uncharacterized protein n=1 Tax=Pseudokineococcus lusitanus TaxID=763993 RepID=A0A3N1HSI9_9ACTN|nr:DUF5703 family protein [Pseudokineococcus lusitanus]ROP45483.1 hypothetical protein EDC03_0086 [Pseudokineococcus lusitanus]